MTQQLQQTIDVAWEDRAVGTELEEPLEVKLRDGGVGLQPFCNHLLSQMAPVSGLRPVSRSLLSNSGPLSPSHPRRSP